MKKQTSLNKTLIVVTKHKKVIYLEVVLFPKNFRKKSMKLQEENGGLFSNEKMEMLLTLKLLIITKIRGKSTELKRINRIRKYEEK